LIGTPLIPGFGIGENGRDPGIPGIRDAGIANTSFCSYNVKQLQIDTVSEGVWFNVPPPTSFVLIIMSISLTYLDTQM